MFKRFYSFLLTAIRGISISSLMGAVDLDSGDVCQCAKDCE